MLPNGPQNRHELYENCEGNGMWHWVRIRETWPQNLPVKEEKQQLKNV